jgi:uncharacterized protein (DUF362 family)
MHSRHRRHRHSSSAEAPRRGFLRRWFETNALLTGIFALAWLLLRSGPRPSRLAYPCQQAAFTTATLALGAPLVSALLAARNAIVSGLRSPAGLVALAVAGLVAGLASWGVLATSEARPSARAPVVRAPLDYRAEVFHVAGCPADPVMDHFPCIDALLPHMGQHGLKFYRSPTVSDVSGPDGIVAVDDVVVVKINYQWSERGGTNTDVLLGLIRAVLGHPDDFGGEVVVAENAQFASTEDFDRAENNAQDISQSPHDVVTHYQGLGYSVSHTDWTLLRTTRVDEYSAGDDTDGYVVYPFDQDLNGAVSYPKFRTDAGTAISLRDGIWDPVEGTYDRERLKLINLPVLKSHHAVYGVTAAVKNSMGVVTTSLGTNSHQAVANGLMGALLGEIRPADSNLVDAIWVNANPFSGPATPYEGATRRDELVASIDPVALDIWATREVLVPAFLENGYEPPWPYPSADPDDPASAFRVYLDNSMAYLLMAGYEVTNDPALIDAHTLMIPIFADGFESGDTSAWSAVVP